MVEPFAAPAGQDANGGGVSAAVELDLTNAHLPNLDNVTIAPSLTV